MDNKIVLNDVPTANLIHRKALSLKEFFYKIGIDKAVFYTLVTRSWGVVAGLLTILFIANFLTPTLQGYYYTFNSLIALQIFAEMGLNFAVIQFASHEMAKLKWMPNGTVSGDPEAKRRLQSIMIFVFLWFAVAALVILALLLPAGLYFLKANDHELPAAHNVSNPWIFLVIFTVCNLFISAAAAILEGCGKVAQLALMRLWQSIFAVTAVWIVLSLGGHLYALTVSSLMMAAIGFSWLWLKYRNFFRDLFAYRTHFPGMNWRKEIWPFQWRIAVSWMSGYLIFQLFNPILFKTHGPIVAGQMGMSLQIVAAMNGAAMAWISTKAPIYGGMVVNNQRKELNSLFARGLLQSLVFLVIGIVCISFILLFLDKIASPYASRVLPLPLFSLLCLACIANHIVSAEAAYLRAHKEEPFMWLSVLNGLATATLALMLVPPFAAGGAVYAYVSSALVIGLAGGTIVFLYKRRQWARR